MNLSSDVQIIKQSTNGQLESVLAKSGDTWLILCDYTDEYRHQLFPPGCTGIVYGAYQKEYRTERGAKIAYTRKFDFDKGKTK